MAFIKLFNQLGRDDAATAGGKGASLGEMTQAGIPVPPGFVILAEAFEQFIAQASLAVEIEAVLSTVNHREMDTVENASKTIQALILGTRMPHDLKTEIEKSFKDLNAEFVAVRSSATAEDGAEAAWAGQLDSFLNTTHETLLEKVRECWSSLFTPRAIFYRFEKGMNLQKISVAVVVQKMVDSDTAGIAFSVHPVTEDRNQMIIEAGFGLGEAVVSGQVTPDSYVVTKRPRAVINKNISEQPQGLYRKAGGGNEWKQLSKEKGDSQVLTDQQILSLAEFLITIESHYGFPVDIEWAMENGELYIVQSRPITTLREVSANGGHTYSKAYTRENCLIAIQIWEEHQIHKLKEKFGVAVPLSIFDAHEGVVHVYYREDIDDAWSSIVIAKAQQDPNFIPELMTGYGEQLDTLEAIWHKGKLSSAKEIDVFFDLASWAWVGLSISYFLPSMKGMRKEEQELGMKLRERSADFLELTDHVIQDTLRDLYPELGDLVKYISIDEIRSGDVPAVEVLRERETHYIYYDFKLYTNTELEEFLTDHHYSIEKEIIPSNVSDIKGQTAMTGIAKGTVRVLHRKADISLLQDGEILVTAMTTPDYLPAMYKAAAFVTDEGGITCHAAIVAREMGKPCVIGTKIATQVLKDNDEVEVDAHNGVIRILKTHTNPEYEEVEFIKNTFPLDVYTLELAWSNAATRSDLNLVPLEVILVFKEGSLTLYCDNAAWQENARRSFSALVDSPELRDARTRRSQEYIRKIQQLIVQVRNGEYSSLVEAHTRIQDALYECMLSFSEENFPGLHSSLLTDELNVLVQDPELSADLLNAKRQSYFQKYEIALLAIASQIEKEKISTPLTFEVLPTGIQKDIEILISFYGWISSGFNEKAKDIGIVIAELNELFATGVSIEKLVQDRSDQLTAALQKRETAEVRLQESLSVSEWTKVVLIQALIEDAKYRIEFGLELIYASRMVYEKIADIYDLSLKELKYLYPSEITELLEERLTMTETKARIKVRSSKEFIVSIRAGVHKELDTFIPPKKEEAVLKGQKAYGGIARGVVRIVNSPEDNHKVTSGDILVSSRTSPELVPAMARAGAIVSELGGMLCHAAIVSREMKKVCLVGVKRATELLHDGDFVEVNADTGVIEIIQE